MHIGKQSAGPINIMPEVVYWGGCIFINCFRRSLMISVPDDIYCFLKTFEIDEFSFGGWF